jgi:hypothetical protein
LSSVAVCDVRADLIDPVAAKVDVPSNSSAAARIVPL